MSLHVVVVAAFCSRRRQRPGGRCVIMTSMLERERERERERRTYDEPRDNDDDDNHRERG